MSELDLAILIAGIGWFLLALSLVGVVYTFASSFAVRWLFSRSGPTSASGLTSAHSPSVTILKPLCGDEPGLAARVAQFCTQDYEGPVQIIFGAKDKLDPAVRIINGLIEAYPDVDIALVIDERVSGSNLKISNLINMERLVKYETLVVADSDVSVTPDYLTRLIEALAQPNVGYATCVYFGVPTGNIWSKISAMSINYHLLPSVALGVRLKMAEPCFGPTMAFRRDVFERAGGFRAFADRLADDFEIGHAIRKLGYTFAISPIAIGHACPENNGHSVVSHELRWARTIRLIDPAGYAGTTVCHPLFFALMAMPFMQGSMLNVSVSLGALALALSARTFLALQVDRLSPLKLRALGMGPLRDLMSTGVFFASFMGRNVMWRGRRLRIAADGDLEVRRRVIRWGAGPWLAGRRASQSTVTPQRILP